MESKYLSVKLVIIDLISYYNTRFLETMENFLMDLSRESLTSTNTSEVETSLNRSFLLSIIYFAFIISFLQLLRYLNLGTELMSLQERLLAQ